MASKLRLSGIAQESIVDGPGLRYVVFVQGCPHHCVGCHNPQTHDFSEGYDMDIDSILEQYKGNPLLAGITFSGGEPFCQPGPLAELGEKIKDLGHTVMVYSGYTLEELLELKKTQPEVGQLLDVADILVDGPYVEALRDLELLFRGSANQRVIELHGPVL